MVSPDSDCLFSLWTDDRTTRVTCGRGEVSTSADTQSPVKIAAGYFSQWPTTSKAPNAATADASAQVDIKTALDAEPELLDQAAGWQNRPVF
jgi:hypothetical protein